MSLELADSASPGTHFISTSAADASTGLARPRLLVVDDDAASIQALYRAFADDHQVLMATSGALGLELCASHLPDLVLLGVLMPDMDGFEVCRRLKADAATRDIPVIFVTGENDSTAEARGLEAGAAEFVAKPINPPIVRTRVRSQLVVRAHAELLRYFGSVDVLTVASNRRHFARQLEIEYGRAKRTSAPLSVLLIDVDGFQTFRDHYGRPAGDDTLRRIAAALRDALKRPGDFVAHCGGEEFACILPGTDTAGAENVGEQLRAAVAALNIALGAPPGDSRVTISVGACCDRLGLAGGASALLEEAGTQLNRAKTEGRNRVCATEL